MCKCINFLINTSIGEAFLFGIFGIFPILQGKTLICVMGCVHPIIYKTFFDICTVFIKKIVHMYELLTYVQYFCMLVCFLIFLANLFLSLIHMYLSLKILDLCTRFF